MFGCMIPPNIVNAIKIKYEALKSELDEKARRLWAAAEANSIGHGGIKSCVKGYRSCCKHNKNWPVRNSNALQKIKKNKKPAG